MLPTPAPRPLTRAGCVASYPWGSPLTAPSHRPVLLGPVVHALDGCRRVVDGTLGHGGHAAALAQAGATILGIDRDPDAIATATARVGPDRLTTVLAPFDAEDALAAIRRFAPDGILLDLGVSSRQLDDEQRGFSYRPGAPLDMRMGGSGPTAADLLGRADVRELTTWFRAYADEPRAGALAREIVRRRDRQAFTTSDDLVNAIRSVLGPRSGPGDFARIFQALRIAVNDELAGLARALPAFLEALTAGGVLAIISYHSGEDRIVKHCFREWSRRCICPPEQPICTCRGRPLGWTEPREGIVPDPDEVAANPRARSARLRIFRKADDP